jgi:hypothetical protein
MVAEMRVIASDQVNADLTAEQRQEFADFFLEQVPEQEIEFVSEAWLHTRSDESKPVYTVAHKDGKRVMIVWPMMDEEGNYLYLTWQHECPWLDGLHEYGPGDFGP